MEVPDKIHPLGWLRKQLEADGGTDLIREMVQAFAEVLMSAEASALCGAGYGERSEDRVNSRNGYRSRAFDTRAGSVTLAIPKQPAPSQSTARALQLAQRIEMERSSPRADP